MEFRILGNLHVLDGDREIAVSGGKLRALLANLLVHANRAVSEDALIEVLWGDGATSRSADNLHVLVSRLRKTIASDRVVRVGGGYLIRVNGGELDLTRFEALRAEGKPHAALELWHGPPLADFTYEQWSVGEIRRLEELRLVTVEERIEADLEAGRHAELVGELQGLVAEYPLREEFRRQLILALYRSGRQAEALEAYRDAHRMLDEELGLEPSPALRELEQAVLRQDPELEAPRRFMPALGAAAAPRRRLLSAVAAAALAFAGAATAFALVDRNDASRGTAAAAQLPVSRPSSTGEVEPNVRPVTTRLIVVQERTKHTGPSRPPRTPTSEPPPPAPQPPAPPPQQPYRPRPKNIPPPPAQPRPEPKSAPERFTDNFDDGMRNGAFWHQILTGTGISLNERNGRLEVEFTADGLAGGDFHVLGAHYGTQCRYLGDFDARIDYELLDWPIPNGVVVQLNAWFTRRGSVSIGRQSQTWDEEYVTWADPRGNSRPTLDSRGSLRIRRVDGTISTHYKSGTQWLSLGSARTTEAPMLAIQAMTTDETFGHKPVRVAFDNFVLVADQPVC